MALTTALLRLFNGALRWRVWSSSLPLIQVVLMVLPLSILAGCGIDESAGTGDFSARVKGGNGGTKATISLSPIKMTFSAVQNDGTTPQEAVAISNSGTGRLHWDVTTDVSWLSLAPTSGTNAGSFTVTAFAPGLPEGTHSANITVTASGATNTPQTIPVSLMIAAPTAVISDPTLASTASTTTISLTPTSVTLSGVEGGSNPSAAIVVSTTGSEALGWSVASDVPWLSVDPGSGITPSSFTAEASLTGLVAGTYAGAITVTEMGTTSHTHTIPVRLTITASQPLMTSASLVWDPHPDQKVIGYFIHYGPNSPNSSGSCSYSNGMYVSLSSITTSAPSATVTDLSLGTTYYFAVSAYDGIVESACSNEVSKAT